MSYGSSFRMIIKSMPYKDANFSKLYAYIQRKAIGESCILRNFALVDDQETESIISGFQENVSLLPPRKNGNLFYHEIISIQPKEGVSMEKHIQALHDLAHHYLEQRASGHLAFGRVHSEPGNIHVHLMVSANALDSAQRHRIPKGKFTAIQRDCERWLNATFPELHQGFIYNKVEPGRETPSRKETERSKRTKKPSRKQSLERELTELLEQVEREGDFAQALKTAGMEFYQRGRTMGVVFEGKKYRLKTLGVLDKYEAAKSRWTEQEKRRRDLMDFYEHLEAQGKREFELPPNINPPVGWG